MSNNKISDVSSCRVITALAYSVKNFHQSTGMTPFKAVYGRDPAPIIRAGAYPSKVEAVNTLVEERDGVLDDLRANICKDQLRMKQQADQKRRDVQHQVGNSVYLKTQPYRLKSLAQRRNEKLSPRYYGPFQITDRVGAVAYQLKPPEACRIHDVFHVSKLKKGVPQHGQAQLLPVALSAEWELQPYPEDILAYRYSGTGALEVLIQWQELPEFENSWESAEKILQIFPNFHLEDKVVQLIEVQSLNKYM